MDDANAMGLGVPRTRERDRLAVEEKVAVIVTINTANTAQDPHQGGSAGSVLADDRMDLTPLYVEGDTTRAWTPANEFDTEPRLSMKAALP